MCVHWCLARPELSTLSPRAWRPTAQEVITRCSRLVHISIIQHDLLRLEPQNKPSVRTIFPELPLAIGTNADLSDSFSPTATALRGVKYSAATRCKRAAIVVGQRYCGTAVTAHQFHGVRQRRVRRTICCRSLAS